MVPIFRQIQSIIEKKLEKYEGLSYYTSVLGILYHDKDSN